MMLGTPARFARLSFTNVRTRFCGANSSIHTAVPIATGNARPIVAPITQTVPRIEERRPAWSAKREG